jgi:signal transduction histidine kinase/ligand-binding sensor domain-containing protein
MAQRHVVLVAMLTWTSCAFASPSPLDVSQYAHTAWRVRDGFIKGTISSVAQTSDGYLWLGTEFGLFRFDGVRAAAWQPPEGQRLPSNHIFSLLASRDGTLWIGTAKGLASWKSGKLREHAELAGQAMRAPMVEDREGTVWAGGQASPPPGKLCAIRQDSVQCDALDAGVSGLYQDRSGTLWVGARDGLWRWRPGPPKFYPASGPAANGGGIQGLAESDDGALLFGSGAGIARISENRTEANPLPFTATRLVRGRDGRLWIGTPDAGLAHVQGERTDRFTQTDGLSGDFVMALFPDREGSIWVATDGGLDRFREYAVPTLTLRQGLSNASVLSVLADRDGSVWLSTRRGLNRWKNGEITVFGGEKRDGLLNGNYAGSMFQDSHGRIWASTLREFGYLEHDRFVPVKGVPGGAVYSIAEDAPGNLWIANREAGLIELTPDGRVQQVPWARLGHQDPGMALAHDSRRGGLWIGFYRGGIVYFAEGQVRESYTAADGPGEGRVNGLRFDSGGTLWAATEGGLSRLKNGRFATLGSRNGLPCDSTHWAMEDDAHSLWLYTTCGLVRVAGSELAAWAALVDRDRNAAPAIKATLFDSSDGVRSIDDPFGYTPHAAKSSDGRLWFLPSDGASVLDPQRLPVNTLQPPVAIEEIIANRKAWPAAGDRGGLLHLPALVRDLEIDYTALSLVAPEKIRFRYKLEGHDTEWQEPGNRRQAFYSNLPPRAYRFRVIASNNSGVWNDTGAVLDFAIEPAFYQAAWFRLSCLVIALGLIAALYRLRLRALRWQYRMRFEERVAERNRVAQDLHDTLLQGMLSASMYVDIAVESVPEDSSAKPALARALELMRQVIEEGRGALQGLRASDSPSLDLGEALSRVQEEISEQSGPGERAAFRVVVEGKQRPLVPLLRDEMYRIGREALINSFRHSRARHVEVLLKYCPDQLRIVIKDDGCGIDPRLLKESRDGHLGLAGMRERAEQIGARLHLSSRASTGTELEVSAPAHTAFLDHISPGQR